MPYTQGFLCGGQLTSYVHLLGPGGLEVVDASFAGGAAHDGIVDE